MLDGQLFDARGRIRAPDHRSAPDRQPARRPQLAECGRGLRRRCARSAWTPRRSPPACLASRASPIASSRWRPLDGVQFVNDSKATNPDAAARALASFDRIYWIAGGRPKEGGLDAAAAVAGSGAPRLSDRRGGRALRARAGGARRRARRAAIWPAPCARQPLRRGRTGPAAPSSCSRRRARRSTSSAISRTAARRSSALVGELQRGPSGRECRLVIRVSRTERGLLGQVVVDHRPCRCSRASGCSR